MNDKVYIFFGNENVANVIATENEYGVRTGSGIHCYNVVNGICFDLTSEQFGEEARQIFYS